MSLPNQRGFSAVEVILAVVIVAAIGATGYLAYDRMKDANNTPSASQQAEDGTAPAAPSVSDTNDLDKAAKTLDETNLDASVSDSAELDSELQNF